MVEPCIGARNAQRFFRAVRQHHAAVRPLRSNRQPYAAAAGTQIQHPGAGIILQIVDRLLGQHLGVTAGNQHMLVNNQRQAEKLPFAHKIGHRFALQPALQQRAHTRFNLRGSVQPVVPVKFLFIFVRSAADNFPRFQRGAVHSVSFQRAARIQI